MVQARQNLGQWENRITGYGSEDPEQILANPKNFRIHPRGQQAQMEAILDKVGFVQNVVINARTQHLVDGHMRVSIALKRGEKAIPVTYVDLTQTEEDFVLATLDPIGDLAAFDREQLSALLDDIGEVDEVAELLASLAEDAKAPANLGDLVDEPDGSATDGVVRLEVFLTTAQAEVFSAAATRTGASTPAAALMAIVHGYAAAVELEV